MSSEKLKLGMKPIDVWPDNAQLQSCGDPTIHQITFSDIQEYHPRLVAKILELEETQRLRRRDFRGACGTRILQLERWSSPEAELLTARARAVFRKVLNCDQAVVDVSWANVFRTGDYCHPHSHLRSTASVVYCLDPGETDAEDKHSGQFCLVDPRLSVCCPQQEGCMTTPFTPEMSSGTMLIFPSQLVHAVNPYTGKRPRITLSWNLNKTEMPGSPLTST